MKRLFMLFSLLFAFGCSPEGETVNPDNGNGNGGSESKKYTVENTADAEDATVNTLGTALINKFGPNYEHRQSKVKVLGTMNEADFKSLLSFEEVDLSEVEVVGTITLYPGEASQIGDAIPFFAFIPVIDNFPAGTNSKLKKLVLPESVNTIGTGAMAMCLSLSEVVMPKSLKTVMQEAFTKSSIATVTSFTSCERIGARAFDGCTKLTEITLPENLETIEDAAFFETSLVEVVIPNSVSTMGVSVFGSCKSLKKATLSSSLEAIPAQMFQKSTIEEVVLPESITAINYAAFLGAEKLKQFTIPSGIKTIMYSAFDGSGLTSIDIPATVEAVQANAFASCSSLESVTVNWSANVPVIGTHPMEDDTEAGSDGVFPDAFTTASGNLAIKVPAGTKDLYAATEGWATYSFEE